MNYVQRFVTLLMGFAAVVLTLYLLWVVSRNPALVVIAAIGVIFCAMLALFLGDDDLGMGD